MGDGVRREVHPCCGCSCSNCAESHNAGDGKHTRECLDWFVTKIWAQAIEDAVAPNPYRMTGSADV